MNICPAIQQAILKLRRITMATPSHAYTCSLSLVLLILCINFHVQNAECLPLTKAKPILKLLKSLNYPIVLQITCLNAGRLRTLITETKQ